MTKWQAAMLQIVFIIEVGRLLGDVLWHWWLR